MQPFKAVSRTTGLVIEATGDPKAPADQTLASMFAHIGDPVQSNEFGAIYEVQWARDGWALYVRQDGAMETDFVIAPAVRIIGREQLGAILPNGWAIEQSLNCYTPFMGEEISLGSCTSLAQAISAIRAFLSTMAAQSSTDLAASYATELSDVGRLALETQTKMDL